MRDRVRTLVCAGIEVPRCGGSGWARWPLGVVRPRRDAVTTEAVPNRSAGSIKWPATGEPHLESAFCPTRGCERGRVSHPNHPDGPGPNPGDFQSPFIPGQRGENAAASREGQRPPLFRSRGQPPRYAVHFLGVGIAWKSTIRSGIGGRSRSGFDCFDSPVRRRPAALRSPLRFRHSQHHFIGFPSGLTNLLRSSGIPRFRPGCTIIWSFPERILRAPPFFLLAGGPARKDWPRCGSAAESPPASPGVRPGVRRWVSDRRSWPQERPWRGARGRDGRE